MKKRELENKPKEIEMEDLTKVKYFTPIELSKKPWFPIKSDSTIGLLIKNGIIKAINVSAIKGKNRWKIPKEEVFKYLVNLEDQLK